MHTHIHMFLYIYIRSQAFKGLEGLNDSSPESRVGVGVTPNPPLEKSIDSTRLGRGIGSTPMSLEDHKPPRGRRGWSIFSLGA